jgi:ComF family protein
LAQAIGAMKFDGRDDLARGLGRLLAVHSDIRALAADCEVCVPVPLAPARARTRGYNQSAILARMIGRALRLPVRYCLRRVRNTPPQHLLGNAQRRRNLIGAFAAKGRVSGAVLLVDDVITSGETMRAAAQALLDAGALKVIAIALARTERDILSAPVSKAVELRVHA